MDAHIGPMKIRASVVIITRDRMAFLERSVAAVLEDPATSELVIVDDGSIDDTWTWIVAQREADGRIRGLRLSGRGPNAARQAGVELATGEVVVLLDDDVVARPGLVSGHLQALADNPRRVVSGYLPVAVPARRGPGDVATIAYARDYQRRCARYDLGQPLLGHLWGGNVSLWRDAALSVGLSSRSEAAPTVFHEDMDFGLRAARAGLEGVFRRDLAATHHHAKTPEAALVDACRRGHGIVKVHEQHSETLGSFDPRQLTEGLPGPVTWGLRTIVRSRLDVIVADLLLRSVKVAGHLRCWPVQDGLFKLARRLNELRGACAESGSGA